ncbi:hypothetical protein TBS_05490 [Thermobispora bispora]
MVRGGTGPKGNDMSGRASIGTRPPPSASAHRARSPRHERAGSPVRLERHAAAAAPPATVRATAGPAAGTAPHRPGAGRPAAVPYRGDAGHEATTGGHIRRCASPG